MPKNERLRQQTWPKGSRKPHAGHENIPSWVTHALQQRLVLGASRRLGALAEHLTRIPGNPWRPQRLHTEFLIRQQATLSATVWACLPAWFPCLSSAHKGSALAALVRCVLTFIYAFIFVLASINCPTAPTTGWPNLPGLVRPAWTTSLAAASSASIATINYFPCMFGIFDGLPGPTTILPVTWRWFMDLYVIITPPLSNIDAHYATHKHNAMQCRLSSVNLGKTKYIDG